MSAARALAGWLDEHEVPRAGVVTGGGAYVIVVTTYAIGFGFAVWAAFNYLLSPSFRADIKTTTGFTFTDVFSMWLTLLALVIAIPLLRMEAPTWWRPTGAGPRWQLGAHAFGLASLAIGVGLWVSTVLLNMPAYPHGSGTGAAVGSLPSAALAGPGEEVIVLAVPLIFLRAVNWPWWAVVPAAVILRLLYHVYYGSSTAGLALWAVGMIVIYLRTHAALGLIFAHSWYDISSTIAGYWSEAAGVAMIAVPIIATLMFYYAKAVRAVFAKRALRTGG